MFNIEASTPRYSQLKPAFFWPLSLLSGLKIVGKKACDVNVGQVKKSGKLKTVFFDRRRFGTEIMVVCAAINSPGKNKQFVFKSCKLWLYN